MSEQEESIEDVIERVKKQCDMECGVFSFMQLDAVHFDRLIAEIERLRVLEKEYGFLHKPGCGGIPIMGTRFSECTCGLDEKLGSGT